MKLLSFALVFSFSVGAFAMPLGVNDISNDVDAGLRASQAEGKMSRQAYQRMVDRVKGKKGVTVIKVHGTNVICHPGVNKPQKCIDNYNAMTGASLGKNINKGAHQLPCFHNPTNPAEVLCRGRRYRLVAEDENSDRIIQFKSDSSRAVPLGIHPAKSSDAIGE